MSNNGIIKTPSIGAQTINAKVCSITTRGSGNQIAAVNARVGKQVKLVFDASISGIPTPISADPNPLTADAIYNGLLVCDIPAGTVTITLDSAANIIARGLELGKTFKMFTYNIGAGTLAFTGGVGTTIVRSPISNTGVFSTALLFTATSTTTVEVVEING